MSEMNDRRRTTTVPTLPFPAPPSVYSPTTPGAPSGVQFALPMGSPLVYSPAGESGRDQGASFGHGRTVSSPAFPFPPATVRAQGQSQPLASPTSGAGTTSIQVAPAVAPTHDRRAGKRAKGSSGAGGGGGTHREARMSWYSTRISFVFLFILFLFAAGNVAGLIYYFKHGSGSFGRSQPSGLSTLSPPPPPPPPPLPPSRRAEHGAQQPELLNDGGNTAMEHESARRVDRGRQVILEVLRREFGALLTSDTVELDVTPPSSRSLGSNVDLTQTGVTWLPAPFFVPVLNRTARAIAARTEEADKADEDGALWVSHESVFPEGYSEMFASVRDASAYFDTLLGSAAKGNDKDGEAEAERLKVNGDDGEEEDVEEEEQASGDDVTVEHKVAQHGKQFQDVITYAHRGLRFATAASRSAPPPAPTAWPVGALPNWRRASVASAMDALVQAEETVEHALFSTAGCSTPTSASPDSGTTCPLEFLPVHWLMNDALAPAEPAALATLARQAVELPSDDDDNDDGLAEEDAGRDQQHNEGKTGRREGPRAALARALARSDVTARQKRHVLPAITTVAKQQRRLLLQLAAEMAYCDPSDASFSPLQDRTCTRYLTNPQNWLAIKPMTSTYASGRTIKFLLSFRHANVSAIVKVPQTGFVLEAMSEVAAYHVDRLLGFRRVPPTALVEMPVAYLRAAAATLDNAFYAHWLAEYVLRSPATARARHTCRGAHTQEHLARNGVRKRPATTVRRAYKGKQGADDDDDDDDVCVWVSVQLWMNDVDAIETTLFEGLANDDAFLVPKQSQTLSPRRGGNDARHDLASRPWHLQDDGAGGDQWPPPLPPHWLSAETAMAANGAALSPQARLFYALSRFQSAALVPPAPIAEGGLVLPTEALLDVPDNTSVSVSHAPSHQRVTAALQALMWKERHDQVLFDTIIDNQDRWEGHNLYVLSGCGPAHVVVDGDDLNTVEPTCVQRRRRQAHSADAASSSSLPRAPFTVADVVRNRPSRGRVPRLVYLDQGSGFFQRTLPRDSPFHALAFATADARGTTPRSPHQRPRRDQKKEPAVLPSERLFCRHLYYPTLARLESVVQQALALHRRVSSASQDGSGTSLATSTRAVRAYLSWRHDLLHKTLDTLSSSSNNNTSHISGGSSSTHEQDGVAARTWRTARVVDGESASLEAAEVGRALYELLRWRLPLGVGDVLPHYLIEAACRRVWSVLANRQRCARRYGEANLYLA